MDMEEKRMNGNRLYRSASEAMLGGVAAGLGNYFKIDATLVRLGIMALTFITGGAFALLYGAMWLLIPTAASTANDPGGVVNENLNDMGARVRSFFGGNGSPMPNGGAQSNGGQAANGGAPTTNVGSESAGNGSSQAQLSQASAAPQSRQGFNPMFLIAIGGFFLLMNLGFFRGFNGDHHGGFPWPLVLLAFGVIMLLRRRS